MTAAKRNFGIYSAVFLLTPLTVFAVILFSQHWIPGHDTLASVYSLHQYLSRFKFEGAFPFWSPYRSWGVSNNFDLLGTLRPSFLMLVPLVKLFSHANILWFFYLSLLIDELILLIGTFLLARLIFKNWYTVLFVCLCLSATVSWCYQICFNFTMIYSIPLCLYFIWRGLSNQRFAWVAIGFGLTFFTSLMGQGIYLIIIRSLFCFVFALGCWGLFPTSPWQLFKKRNAWDSLAVAAALFALGLPLLFLCHDWNYAFDVAGRSAAGGTDYWEFLAHGADEQVNTFSGLFSGLFSYFDGSIYTGILVAPLAIWGLLFAPQRKQVPFLLVGIFTFLFWMGRYSFLAPLLFHVPGVSFYRNLGLITPLLKIVFVFLAGFGFERFIDLKLTTKWDRTKFEFVALAAIITLILAGFTLQMFLNFSLTPRTAFTWLIFFGFLMILGLALLHRGQFLKYLAVALLGLTLIDVLTYRSDLFHQNLVRLDASEWKLFDLRPSPDLSTRPLSILGSKEGNIFARLFLAQPNNIKEFEECVRSSPDCNSHFAHLLGVTYQNIQPFINIDSCVSPLRNDVYTLGAVDIRRALGLNLGEFQPLFLKKFYSNSLQQAAVGCGAQKFALYDGVEVLPEDQVHLKLGRGEGSAPLFMATIDSFNDYQKSLGVSMVPATAVHPAQGEIKLLKLGANQVSLEVENPSGSQSIWLTYFDSTSPLWKAFVDGVATPILETNLAFKSIQIPAGKNVKVDFRYDTAQDNILLFLLFIISLITVLATLAFGVVHFRRAVAAWESTDSPVKLIGDR